MQQKTVKRIVDIIVAVIMVIILLITINILVSSKKGYVPFFGTASLAVKSDSMVGDNEDSFNVGDLIFIKILSEDEKKDIEVGSVITFYDVNLSYKDGTTGVNSHRVISKSVTKDGVNTLTFINENGEIETQTNNDSGTEDSVRYITKGDHEALPDSGSITIDSIIGVYTGKIVGGGKISLIFSSQVGFLCFVVIPSFLILAYCVFLLVKNILDRNKALSEEKVSASLEQEKERVRQEERERIRQELLSEMQTKDKKTDDEQ